MLFLLKILLTILWPCRDDWLGLPDIVLAFPVSSYIDFATPEDSNTSFTDMEKYSLLTSFVVHIGLPKGQFHPCFSLLLPSQGACFHHKGLRTPEGPDKNYIHKQPIPLTVIKHLGTGFGQLHFCRPQSKLLFPSSASSRNHGQLHLSYLGWRVWD